MATPITDYVNINDYVMIVQDGCIKNIRFEDFIKGISLGGFSVCQAWLNCIGGIGEFPPDGDSLAAVIIEGNTMNYRLNGNPVISGTQIARSLIEMNQLVFIAPDTDSYNEDSTIWKAVDSAGSISI